MLFQLIVSVQLCVIQALVKRCVVLFPFFAILLTLSIYIEGDQFVYMFMFYWLQTQIASVLFVI